MCGVVGMFGRCPAPEDVDTFARLLAESRARGTHAAGFAWADPDPALGHGYHRSHDFPAVLESLALCRAEPPCCLVGHTRYSTSGDWRDPANHQPVDACCRYVALNGVLDGGTRAEFNARWGVDCASANDAEIFPRRLALGDEPAAFAARIKGSLAAAWLDVSDPARPALHAVRNARRPLYRAAVGPVTFLASTADILRRAGLERWEPLNPGVLYSWPTD